MYTKMDGRNKSNAKCTSLVLLLLLQTRAQVHQVHTFYFYHRGIFNDAPLCKSTTHTHTYILHTCIHDSLLLGYLLLLRSILFFIYLFLSTFNPLIRVTIVVFVFGS